MSTPLDDQFIPTEREALLAAAAEMFDSDASELSPLQIGLLQRLRLAWLAVTLDPTTTGKATS